MKVTIEGFQTALQIEEFVTWLNESGIDDFNYWVEEHLRVPEEIKCFDFKSSNVEENNDRKIELEAIYLTELEKAFPLYTKVEVSEDHPTHQSMTGYIVDATFLPGVDWVWIAKSPTDDRSNWIGIETKYLTRIL